MVFQLWPFWVSILHQGSMTGDPWCFVLFVDGAELLVKH